MWRGPSCLLIGWSEKGWLTLSGWNMRVGNVAMHILNFWEVLLWYMHQLWCSNFIGEPRKLCSGGGESSSWYRYYICEKREEEMGIERKAEKSKWERAERKPTIHCRAKCNNVNDFQPMSSVPCEMNKPIRYLENWEWLKSWCMVKFHIFCEQPHAHAIKAKHCCWHAPAKRERSSK